jgi:CheY-like chemotaxis protein
MGGEEAMRKLLEIDPAVKAVMSSGYSDGAIAAEYREHGFSAFLKKPYTIDELQAALVSLLAQGPERAGKEAGAP